MRRILILSWLIIGVAVVLPHNAEASTPLTDFWSIDLAYESGVAMVEICVPNADEVLAWNGPLSKTWGDPTEQDPSLYLPIGDSGAVLRWLTVEVNPSHVRSLHFSVQSNSTPTNFYITSPVLSFPTIDATGMASAGVTVTDTDGNGATATGLRAGSKFYEALYNGTGSFATLITSPVSAGSYESSLGSGQKDWTYIGPVNSIQSLFEFQLSANDILGATSVFVIVPEPITTTTLAVGFFSLVGVRCFRRRK